MFCIQSKVTADEDALELEVYGEVNATTVGRTMCFWGDCHLDGGRTGQFHLR